MTPHYAWVGSRTTRARRARGEGISLCRCDPVDGTLAGSAQHYGKMEPFSL